MRAVELRAARLGEPHDLGGRRSGGRGPHRLVRCGRARLGHRGNGPVAITATAMSAEGATVDFEPRQHIQRPGLLVANGAVYAAFGSHADQLPYHGWMMSYDASDLSRQIGVYLATPSGQGGSIWQSGRGLAADDQGNVYAMTGNGDYDGAQNFGESFLKLSGGLPLRSLRSRRMIGGSCPTTILIYRRARH